ncbi:Unknown protein, partial [Striga hermonthica]
YSQPQQYAPPNNRPPFQLRPEFQGYQPRPEFQGYQQGRGGFVPRQPMPPPPELEKELKAPTSDPRIDNMEKYLQSLASTVSTLHETVKGVPSIQASLKCLETQMGKLGTSIGEMQRNNKKDRLPSQPEQAQAVTVLRSGKVVDNRVEMPNDVMVEDVDEKDDEKELNVMTDSGKNKQVMIEEESKEKTKPDSLDTLHKSATPYRPPVPYPSRLQDTKRNRQFKDLLDMLSKVNVNLPLLDVIKNVSAYVQFFKDLASKKRRFEDNEKVMISEVASTMIPRKECDPGGFMIKITLGNGKETNEMLDLGAGINLMPYSIFKQLDLGDLKPTRMCLQLADCTLSYPKGVIEDILIRVGNLIVSADFVVLDVGEVPNTGNEHTILLGRLIMATTNTLINVKDGRVTLSALGKTVTFTMSEAKTTPSFTESCSYVDVIEAEVHNIFHAD